MYALSKLPWMLQVPLQFRLGPLTTISIGIGLLARGGKGATYRKSTLPKEPIEIWGYEASPFVKLAREVGACPQPTRTVQAIQPCDVKGCV